MKKYYLDRTVKFCLIGLFFLCIVFIVFAALPTHTTPVLNATNVYNNTNANLTVYNQSTADSDGNIVKNIIDWRVNNVSMAVLNAPFEAGANANDYASYSINGSVSGATFNSSSGYDGKSAYVFDGVNDFIDYGNPTAFRFGTGDFSVSLWTRIPRDQSYGALVAYWKISQYAGYQIRAHPDGTVHALIANSGDTFVDLSSTINISDNNWHHIVLTNVGTSSHKLYIDNVLRSSSGGATISVTQTTNNFFVGKLPDSVTYYFNGTIDQLLVFNRSLSAAEISMFYNNQTNLIDSAETSTGDSWSACLTPNDGTSDGQMLCSNQVTITSLTNLVPSHTTPILNATNGNNNTNQNLTVYNQTTADTDGNTVKNIIDWRVNNVSLAILNTPLEANTNTTLVQDYSSRSTNGTTEGGITQGASTGVDGTGAYTFDGINDDVSFGDILDNDVTGANKKFTMMAWVKMQATGASNNMVFAKVGGGAVNEREYLLRILNNQTNFLWYGDLDAASFQSTIAPMNLVPNTWYHLAVSYDGTLTNVSIRTLIYVNGVNQSLTVSTTGAPSTIQDSASPFLIGALGNSLGVRSNFFNGTIDYVQVYNRTLSARQISEIYNNQTNLIDSAETATGETWSACITPNDGTSDGQTLCSNSLTILSNTLPSHTTPVLNATNKNNNTNQNLTVYNQTTADTDGNTVKNIIDWRVNNVSIAVLNLPFEGGSTNGSAIGNTNGTTTDFSSTHLNATVVANTSLVGPSYLPTGGYDGKGAYEFSHPKDYIELAALNVSANNLTVSVWFKSVNVTSPQVFYYIGSGNQLNHLACGIMSTSFVLCSMNDSHITSKMSTIPLSNDTWYYLLVTKNEDTIKDIYLNGVNRTTSAPAGNYWGTSGGSISTLGRKGIANDGMFPFNGTLDEFQMYNRTLSASQVRMLYNNQTNMIDSAETTTGQSWSACITPNDGTSDGQTLCSNQLTIAANSAPSVPALNLPLNNTNYSYNNIELNWSNSSDIDGDPIRYFLQIASDNAFSSIEHVNTSITETSNVTIVSVSSLANGTHYWRLLATDGTINSTYSEIRTFNTTVVMNDTAAPIISLISNNNTLPKKTNIIFLNWTTTDDTALSSTWIQIRNISGVFNNTPQVITSTSAVGNNTYVVNDPKNTNVSFLVFVNDTSNNINTIGTTLSFLVQNTAPAIPILNAPVNITPVNYPVLIINWSNSTDIDNDNIRYYVEISNVNTFSSIEQVNTSINETTNVTGASFTNLANSLHYWRVLATDGSDNSSFSETRQFNYTLLPPVTSSITLNTTIPKKTYLVILNWTLTDDTALASTWIQIKNSSGTFNATPQTLDGTSGVGNYTYTVNDNKGSNVSFYIFGNDTNNNISTVGAPVSLIVQNTAPITPSLYLPINHTNSTFLPMSLNWSNSTDIDIDNISYYVEVSTVANFASLEYVNLDVNETTNVTNVITSGLTNGTHYWRVLATDNTANSSFSEIRQFNATITQNDTIKPFISSIQSTTSEPNNGDTITLNWSMTDETALSSTWIQVRNSTSVINSTIQIITGTSNESNYTYTVGDISGTILSFTAFVNDTRNNVNSTTQNFTVASTTTTPTSGPSKKEQETEDISVKLSGPKLVYFGKNTKEKIVGITITNNGNVPLNNLEVTTTSRGPLDIYLTPSFISRLPSQKEKTVLLTIKKLEDAFEPVDITISVESKDPETTDSYDITINSGVKPKEQTETKDETTEEDVQQQLALLEKLLNEYQQCKNIPDLLAQAKDELTQGNIAKSQELLDFALTNCRDTLQAEQQEQPITLITPENKAVKIGVIAGAAILLSLLGYTAYTKALRAACKKH